MTDRYLTHVSIRDAFCVVLLSLANFLNYMDRYILFGILLEVQSFYNLSDTQAGLLQTVFLISYMIFSIVFGVVGDIVERKYLIIIGIALWSSFTFAGSFVPSQHYGWFYLTRCLVGIGEASISTLGLPLIGDLFNDTARTFFLCLFYMACPIGGGLGYLVGPQIVKLTHTWQWALRVTPGVGLLVILLLAIVMREPRRGAAEFKNTDDVIRKPSSPDTLSHNNQDSFFVRMIDSNFKYFLRRRSFVYSTLGYTGVSFVFGGLGVWVPKYFILINTHFTHIPGHVPNNDIIGLIFGAITCATGFFGSIAGGAITSCFRHRFVRVEVYLCLFCSAFASIFLFFTVFFSLRNLIFTWIATGLTLTSLSLMWTPNSEIMLNVLGPTHRSRGSCIQILIIHSLGDAISPVLIGFASDHLKKDSSNYWGIRSLYEVLYVTPFVLSVASVFYVLALKNFEADKEATIQEAPHYSPTIVSSSLSDSS